VRFDFILSHAHPDFEPRSGTLRPQALSEREPRQKQEMQRHALARPYTGMPRPLRLRRENWPLLANLAAVAAVAAVFPVDAASSVLAGVARPPRTRPHGTSSTPATSEKQSGNHASMLNASFFPNAEGRKLSKLLVGGIGDLFDGQSKALPGVEKNSPDRTASEGQAVLGSGAGAQYLAGRVAEGGEWAKTHERAATWQISGPSSKQRPVGTRKLKVAVGGSAPVKGGASGASTTGPVEVAPRWDWWLLWDARWTLIKLIPPLSSQLLALAPMVASSQPSAYHQPSRLDQIDQSQISDSP